MNPLTNLDQVPAMAADEAPYPPIGYAWYVVVVLMVAYVFSFVDRQILSLLVQPIRRDLEISDTQMSLLLGFSFAVFYSFFGILLGRLADSRSRRTIIVIGFSLWSLMTAGCGLARNFVQMLLLRMGVGVGEATLSPAAYSLIADYFPPERRATALGVYSIAIYLGSGFAFLLGGLVLGLATGQELWSLPILGPTQPWRVVFFVVGLPGILLALLVFTVREPVRRGLRLVKAADGTLKTAGQTPLREVFAYILENKRTVICHNVGFALLTLASYGNSFWVPTFFIRVHGWSASRIGIVYGVLNCVFGVLGVMAGGRFADWLRERGYRDANMRVALIAGLCWLPFGALYLLVPDARGAVLLLAPALFFSSAPWGVAAAAIQQMMPNAMRGQASALYLFTMNLIGLGLGPTAVALMTDYVFRNEQSVNFSILVVGVTAQLSGVAVLWAGLKPFLRSVDRVKEWMMAGG
ncbi:MAG: spinster family MFS transporter [Candidatus Binatia bacterium]